MILQVIQYRSIGECIRDIPPWRCSKRSRNDGRYNTSPSQFQWRNIFMSMFNDIEWWTSQNESKCVRDAVEVANYSRNVAHGCWSFLGSGNEKSNMVRNQPRHNKGEIERHRTQGETNSNRADTRYFNYPLGKESAQKQTWKRNYSLLYRFQAVLNCLWGRYWKWVKKPFTTLYQIWYDQVQKIQ